MVLVGSLEMWQAKSDIIDMVGLSDRYKYFLHLICGLFSIPDKGTIIIFDANDYDEYINPTWRFSALHMNLKFGGIEEMSPEHILKIMESKQYEHLIWFSKRVFESRYIEFSWTVAHEFRHLQQEFISNVLSKAGHFLYLTIGGINIEEYKIDVTVPTELDAELAAWKTIRHVFGVRVADSYVVNNSISGKRCDAYKVLNSHDPDTPYDVVGSTINLLRKYQPQLEELQNKLDDDFLKKFNIGKACEALLDKRGTGYFIIHEKK
jgi:hypothetical protein